MEEELLNQLKSGDRVSLVRRGAIDWEEFDYTNEDYADLKDGANYTVHDSCYDCDEPHIILREDVWSFAIHPNHFVKLNIHEQ